MKCFRAGPTMPIGTHDPTGFPLNTVRHQYNAGLAIIFLVPNNQDTDFVLNVRNAQRASEVPLFQVAYLHDSTSTVKIQSQGAALLAATLKRPLQMSAFPVNSKEFSKKCGTTGRNSFLFNSLC